MTEQERILQSILDLRRFARENQYHDLVEELDVALEAYIKEESSNENVRTAILSALKQGDGETNEPQKVNII